MGSEMCIRDRYICDEARKDPNSAMMEKQRDSKTQSDADKAANKKTKKAGLLSSLMYVFESPEVACLAVMAVAQGLSSIIFQVAWKTQLRIYRPDPTSYAAYMGDVQTYSGMVTGIFMVAAPFLLRILDGKGRSR